MKYLVQLELMVNRYVLMYIQCLYELVKEEQRNVGSQLILTMDDIALKLQGTDVNISIESIGMST